MKTASSPDDGQTVESHAFRAMLGRFVLAQNQGAIALQFAKPASDKFRDIPLEYGIDDIPLIIGTTARLECMVEQRYPGGDHELLIGRVVRAHSFDLKPLVYGQGQFGDFSIAKSEGTSAT